MNTSTDPKVPSTPIRAVVDHILKTVHAPVLIGVDPTMATSWEVEVNPPTSMSSLFQSLTIKYTVEEDGTSAVLAWRFTHHGGGANGRDIARIWWDSLLMTWVWTGPDYIGHRFPEVEQ